MSLKTFLVTLVSPEKIVVSDQFSMVVVPATRGDMGILAHHMPLISTLGTGLVKFYQQQTVVQQFYIQGGFVDVTDLGCFVMADDCVALENLDLETLRLKIDEKNQALEASRTDQERAALKRDLQFANLQLTLLKGAHQPKAM